MTFSLSLAWLAALAWAGMLLFRGRFWIIDRPAYAPEPDHWPAVAVAIPARDEAAVIGRTVRSLLEQDYPGALRIVIADDDSSDGTARVVEDLAIAMEAADRVRVVTTPPLPKGWSGKLWAQSQAIAAAERDFPETELLLLSDADICHAPEQLRHMVARLLAKGLDMASLMVRLSTDTPIEKALVPAFVYFFRLLYPFRWVSDPLRRTAAAAGGYMLIRRRMLTDIGGLAAIRGALIDDCTLAATIKAAAGHIALDMTETTVSTRTYASWRDLWMMIARSAYTQLRHSPLLLAGTVAAMAVAFLLPPLFVLSGSDAAGPALLAWILMSVSFAPMLAFYRLPAAWAPLLPVVALFYLGATLDSARRHFLGHGGEWKGRVQGTGSSESQPK